MLDVSAVMSHKPALLTRFGPVRSGSARRDAFMFFSACWPFVLRAPVSLPVCGARWQVIVVLWVRTFCSGRRTRVSLTRRPHVVCKTNASVNNKHSQPIKRRPVSASAASLCLFGRVLQRHQLDGDEMDESLVSVDQIHQEADEENLDTFLQLSFCLSVKVKNM